MISRRIPDSRALISCPQGRRGRGLFGRNEHHQFHHVTKSPKTLASMVKFERNAVQDQITGPS